MNQFQKHCGVFYNFVDGCITEKVPFDKVLKIQKYSTISNEDAMKIIDELNKLSILTFKIFNEKKG